MPTRCARTALRACGGAARAARSGRGADSRLAMRSVCASSPAPSATDPSPSSTPPLPSPLPVGFTFVSRRAFALADAEAWAALTGDRNPIHFDAGAAAKAGFSGEPSVGGAPHAESSSFSPVSSPLSPPLPGALVASTIPATLAAVFPGAIYLRQSVRFRTPVLAGSEVETRLEVVKCSGRRAAFKTTVVVVDAPGTGSRAAPSTALPFVAPLRVRVSASPPEDEAVVAIDGEALTLLPPSA